MFSDNIFQEEELVARNFGDVCKWQMIRENITMMERQGLINQKQEESIRKSQEHNTSYGRSIALELTNVITQAINSRIENRKLNKNKLYRNIIKPAIEQYDGLDTKARKFNQHPVESLSTNLAIEIAKGISLDLVMNEVCGNAARRSMLSFNIPYIERDDLRPEFVKFYAMILKDVAVISDYIEINTQRGASQTITLSPQYAQHLDELKQYESVPIDVFKPMVCPPRRHNNLISESGGFLLMGSPLLKHPELTTIVKSFNRSTARTFFETIDRIQETPYKINTNLLSIILQHHSEKGLTFTDFPMNEEEHKEELERLVEKAIQEKQDYYDALRDHKISKGEQVGEFKVSPNTKRLIRRDITSPLKGQVLATKAIFSIAAEYAGIDRFYFPVFLDNRGRIYPYSNTSLSPTGNELGKHLLNFAETKRPNLSGIKEYFDSLGNALGFDKYHSKVKRKKAREFWREHKEEFLRGDYSIIYNIQNEIDEPINAMAICSDLVQFKTDKEWKSGYIRHQDARCSGVALNSVLLRDREAAKLTSVIDSWGPDLKLEDAYQACANRVQELLAQDEEKGEELAALISKYKDQIVTRKNIKTNVMVVSNYGGTLYGVKEDTAQRFLSTIPGFTKLHVAYYAKLVMKAIDDCIVCSKLYRDAALEAGKICSLSTGGINVINPITLFPVSIRNMVSKSKRMLYSNLDGSIGEIRQNIKTGKVDHKKNQTGTPPHLIHCLDASLLFLVWSKCDFNLSTIHDSIGAHVNDCKAVRAAYNDALHHVATHNPLRVMLETMSNGRVSAPYVGTMTDSDIEGIKTAKYSIC